MKLSDNHVPAELIPGRKLSGSRQCYGQVIPYPWR